MTVTPSPELANPRPRMRITRVPRADREAESLHGRPPLPKKLFVGCGILVLFVALAIAAPWIERYPPLEQNVLNRLAEPSGAHWFGTDEVGRDVWSRWVNAARIDLRLGFLIAFLPLVAGTILGAIAGYYGKIADTAVMRTADLVQAFPIYIFIVAMVVALGAGERSIIIAFLAVSWVLYARLVRAEVLRIRNMEYILAARSGGLSNRRVLTRHVLPNALSQTIVYFPADVLIGILSLGAFSYLGLGIQPPTPEWGGMIAAGQPYIQTQWWLVTIPGVFMVFLGSGLMLIADGLDDYLRAR